MTYIALEELNHLWYPDELEKFGELCKAGLSISEMAAELRRSEDEVMVLIIDFKRRSMTAAQLTAEHERWDRSLVKNTISHIQNDSMIREAYYKGKGTLDEIAMTLGMTKNALSYYITQRRKEDHKKWPRKKETQRKNMVPKKLRKRGKNT